MTMAPGPLGIICAIPDEIAHFIAGPEVAADEGGFRFHRVDLEGRSVVLVEAGMGKVNAAVVATLLLERFRCSALLFSGVAGGLDPDLAVGDVVIARRVVQHDCGMFENGALKVYQAGHLPFFMPSDQLGWDLAPDLETRLRQAAEGFVLPEMSAAATGGRARTPRLTFGTILTGDQFVNCPATRQRLHDDLGGQAAEMEGAAVAQVAERFGRPWVIVRSLSDLAGEQGNMDFVAFIKETAAGAAAVLRRLVPVI